MASDQPEYPAVTRDHADQQGGVALLALGSKFLRFQIVMPMILEFTGANSQDRELRLYGIRQMILQAQSRCVQRIDVALHHVERLESRITHGKQQ